MVHSFTLEIVDAHFDESSFQTDASKYHHVPPEKQLRMELIASQICCATMEVELLVIFSIFFIKVDAHIFCYISYTRAYYAYIYMYIYACSADIDVLPALDHR